MDSFSSQDKRKVTNEKRLLSLKKWKQSLFSKKEIIRSSLNTLDSGVTVLNKRTIFEIDAKDSLSIGAEEDSRKVGVNKLVLFESSDSEDDEKRFRIRPQFEGQTGLQLLEMNSHFSDQFKLDERFTEDFGDKPHKLSEDKSIDGIHKENANERLRNFGILEQVLGCQVPGKEIILENKLPNKRRLLRFDPDDESSLKYMRKTDQNDDVPKTENMSDIQENSIAEVVPISTERYFEVSSSLKEILESSTEKFNLSQKCNSKIEEKNAAATTSFAFGFPDKQDPKSFTFKNSDVNESVPDSNDVNYNSEMKLRKTSFAESHQKKRAFFISEDDSRLKEGVEFFMRPKPIEEIREEWSRTRDHVLELYKHKKKIIQKISTKSQRNPSQQNSNMKK